MGQTIAEKILSAHVDGEVQAGDLAEVQVDLVLANDITAPISIREFERIGVGQVFDPDKIALVPDHFAPNKDIKAAEQCKQMHQFARSQEITNYFQVGRMGIEHVLLPEQGLALPGDVIVGADHYNGGSVDQGRAYVFHGSAVPNDVYLPWYVRPPGG